MQEEIVKAIEEIERKVSSGLLSDMLPDSTSFNNIIQSIGFKDPKSYFLYIVNTIIK